jgi:hypothetical protein
MTFRIYGSCVYLQMNTCNILHTLIFAGSTALYRILLVQREKAVNSLRMFSRISFMPSCET